LKKSRNLDAFDRRIRTVLQRDGRIANNDLARAIGLSPTPCWRRVRRLEREGVIDRYVALLDPEKVNLGVTV